MKLGSYDGAWCTEHRGTPYMTESQLHLTNSGLMKEDGQLWMKIWSEFHGLTQKFFSCLWKSHNSIIPSSPSGNLVALGDWTSVSFKTATDTHLDFLQHAREHLTDSTVLFVLVKLYVPSACLVVPAVQDMCSRSMRVWCHIPCDNQDIEDTRHFLLECKRYSEEREEMINTIKSISIQN